MSSQPKQQQPPALFRDIGRPPLKSTTFTPLTGHTDCFKQGQRPGTILKRATGNEQSCLSELSRDSLAQFVPKLHGVLQLDGQLYLEMDDLLAGFSTSATSIMDVKMGYRTYLEAELYSAIRESKLRHDMFDKMVEIDENEPTDDERKMRAVTKPRYMIWRETISSTADLGFRLEAMRLRDGTTDKNFKTVREQSQIAKAVVRFTRSRATRLKYLRRLYDLRQALLVSNFFLAHELIGSSLLFVHDDNIANVWLIDFAKTYPLPEDVKVNHKNKWELGNHEDGYLAGLDNLIGIFESILAMEHDGRLVIPERVRLSYSQLVGGN